MTLTQFIAEIESYGYTRWTLTRFHHYREGVRLDRYTARIQSAVITLEASEETLEDTLDTLFSVIQRLHGADRPSVEEYPDA
jgi:hypothetical protein